MKHFFVLSEVFGKETAWRECPMMTYNMTRLYRGYLECHSFVEDDDILSLLMYCSKTKHRHNWVSEFD